MKRSFRIKKFLFALFLFYIPQHSIANTYSYYWLVNHKEKELLAVALIEFKMDKIVTLENIYQIPQNIEWSLDNLKNIDWESQKVHPSEKIKLESSVGIKTNSRAGIPADLYFSFARLISSVRVEEEQNLPDSPDDAASSTGSDVGTGNFATAATLTSVEMIAGSDVEYTRALLSQSMYQYITDHNKITPGWADLTYDLVDQLPYYSDISSIFQSILYPESYKPFYAPDWGVYIFDNSQLHEGFFLVPHPSMVIQNLIPNANPNNSIFLNPESWK